VDGHVASLTRFSGLAFLPDGAVGTVNFASVSDYTNGAGTFTLYPILTFDDGSVLWMKSVGTGTIDGAITRFVGTLTVIGGKGRFEDAKCTPLVVCRHGRRAPAAEPRRDGCLRTREIGGWDLTFVKPPC
jgi:hypothetical protein